MGSENSTQNVRQNSAVDDARVRASSPQSSVCSDTDIPYISYTVNQPIGDSPKPKTKSFGPSMRSNTNAGRNVPPSKPNTAKQKREKMKQRSTTVHDVVVVRKAVSEEDTVDNDPELNHLTTIPTFLPIMRGALNIPMIRDPEVLDKLDYKAFFQMLNAYQQHLRACAKTVSTEQNALSRRIQEIDFAISTLINLFTEEQKKLSNCVEKLNKVTEISSTVAKCQKTFDNVLVDMEVLNKMLPLDDQLDPFVTTG